MLIRFPLTITNKPQPKGETWPKLFRAGLVLLIVLLALIFFIFPAMDLAD